MILTFIRLVIILLTFRQVTSIGSGKWGGKGPMMSRPPYSDADGMLAIEKNSVVCPSGWQFQGDWFIAPDPRLVIRFRLNY